MAMNVIAKRTLRQFWENYPDVEEALEDWYRIMRRSSFNNFAEIKDVWNSVDWVKDYLVFNIRGNHYRLITTVRFDIHTIWIKEIMTHRQYNSWTPSETL
jgi:mRNA interferase HigB